MKLADYLPAFPHPQQAVMPAKAGIHAFALPVKGL